MAKIILEGNWQSDKELEIALVVSRFNSGIVSALLDGAMKSLLKNGVNEEKISIVRVPGTLEIAGVVSQILKTEHSFSGILGLGAVIRGDTPHFKHISEESARQMAQLSVDSDIPIISGVLSTNNLDQALDRSIGKTNQGADSALVLLEMISLYKKLKAPKSSELGFSK